MQAPSHYDTENDALPGRLYSFVVLALATTVLGLSVHAGFAYSTTTGSGPDVSVQSIENDVQQTLPVRQTSEAKIAGGELSEQRASELSTRQLLGLFGVAALVGLVGLLPSRSTTTRVRNAGLATAADIAKLAELPLLGSVLRGEPKDSSRPKQRSQWLTSCVFLCELVLCAAVVLAIYGSLTGDAISSRFLSNPIAAYIDSVQHAIDLFQGWLS